MCGPNGKEERYSDCQRRLYRARVSPQGLYQRSTRRSAFCDFFLFYRGKSNCCNFQAQLSANGPPEGGRVDGGKR